jgi:hypothetical protein
MDRRTTFETRAVLAGKGSRVRRVTLLVPALALVVTAWAGLSARPSATETPSAPNVAAATHVDVGSDPASGAAAEGISPAFPREVVGLEVHGLADIQTRTLTRDDVVAVSGWYVPTAIGDCPTPRDEPESLASCDRTGALFASRPNLSADSLRNLVEEVRARNAGRSAVAATLAIGVVAPPELEAAGTTATPVVVVGHFVKSGETCIGRADCPRHLIVDHIAWTPSG